MTGSAVPAEEGVLITALDFPPPHLIEFGAQNRFRGMVLDARDRAARTVRVRLDEEAPREFPADRPSEDLAAHLPGLPAARNCRFEFPLLIPESAKRLAWEAIWEDGSAAPLFEYDLETVRESAARLAGMRQKLEALSAPPGDVVFLTQGHRDTTGYVNSIIPGVWNMRRYLEACGIAVPGIRRLLDFGCGSGRLLTGWWLDDPTRVLVGCDSSAALTDWARANLPTGIRIDRTSGAPPLPYAAAEFDFAFAVSVLTHLRYRTQQILLQDLARVIEPGGTLLVTAHGPLFVKLFAPDRVAEFLEQGHWETEGAEDGSNAFASFHAPRQVAALSEEFELLEYFPEGRIGGRRVLFPLAGMQDVYVLRRR
jgi:SAM-dependent methyltransferase